MLPVFTYLLPNGTWFDLVWFLVRDETGFASQLIPTPSLHTQLMSDGPHHQCLCPLLFLQSILGSFTSLENQVNESAVRPGCGLNSRRLKCLTSICRCQSEDSTFFSLISTPRALVRPEIESRPTFPKSGTQAVELTKPNYWFESDILWSVIPSYFRDSILQQRRVKTPKMKRLKTSKKK